MNENTILTNKESKGRLPIQIKKISYLKDSINQAYTAIHHEIDHPLDLSLAELEPVALDHIFLEKENLGKREKEKEKEKEKLNHKFS
tara:strand:+ start:1249 stop:1509 length:261 start_codon:yes stop_codon:yes gene_type:complete